MDVSAIVVSWNTADLLDACLRSLRDHAPADRTMEVIVVDNGSDDGSPELVEREWPGVHLIRNAENQGYQRACNAGIVAATGRTLLLINADAELRGGVLDRMLADLDVGPDVAVVGPRLEYADGSFQRWTAGRTSSVRSAAIFLLLLERLPWLRRRGMFLALDVAHPFHPEWVSSACMLVRSTALDEVGPLDERYFCYMDDVDICRRLVDAGWKVLYDPRVTVTHHMGQSTRRRTGAASPTALRNLNDYIVRHGPRGTAPALRAVEVVGFGLRALAYAALGALQKDTHARTQARAHLRNVRISMEREAQGHASTTSRDLRGQGATP